MPNDSSTPSDSERWEEVHREKSWGTCPNEHMARFVKRHVPKGAYVLELGCGVGANVSWLSNNFYCTTGIDASATAVRAAVPLDVRLGNVTDLPFNNGYFDCVVDVCCLQHVRESDKALKEAYRVLKPNGWIFSVWAGYAHADTAFPVGVYTRKLVDGIEAFYLMRHHGFEEIKTFRSSYEDEVYGRIEHWLTQGQKLAAKG